MPANNGDILIIPSPNFGAERDKRITIHWQQKFSQQSAEYYALVVKNKSQDNAEVVFFIAAEWNNEGHLSSVASKDAEGNFELKIDDKIQYGQKKQGRCESFPRLP